LIRETLQPEDADRMLSRWPETFEARIDSSGIPKKPGVDALLDLIELRQLPVALATSTSRERTIVQLASVGLDTRFATMATGDEVVNGKPSPDIYLLAADRLGVDPASCFALEDSNPGVEAASTAGMRVIMVPDLIEPTPELAARAECVCRNLEEAREFLHTYLPGGMR